MHFSTRGVAGRPLIGVGPTPRSAGKLVACHGAEVLPALRRPRTGAGWSVSSRGTAASHPLWTGSSHGGWLGARLWAGSRPVNPPRCSGRPPAEISSHAKTAEAQGNAELIDLVLRAQRDDMAAQTELVRRYTVRISAFVRSILFQPSSVEDVVQMVFIKMVRRLRLLRDPAVFESWLFRLSRNTAVDFLRRRRCRPTMVSDESEFERAPDTSSERPVAEIMEALAIALTHLSPKDRNLVTMIVEGNSYRTVAEREGLTVGAVKVRMNRVRPFLRVSVGEAVGVRLSAPTGGRWRQLSRAHGGVRCKVGRDFPSPWRALVGVKPTPQRWT